MRKSISRMFGYRGADVWMCSKCNKRVYFAELLRGSGDIYHKKCFRCVQCNKRLNPGEYLTHKNSQLGKEEPFCKTCYTRQKGPHGFRGGGSGLMGVQLPCSDENPMFKRDISTSSTESERPSAQKSDVDIAATSTLVDVNTAHVIQDHSSANLIAQSTHVTNPFVYSSNIIIKDEGCALLIIDPQVDFHPGGSLAIDGADEDAKRISDLIISKSEKINEIYVTLDTHMKYHIAHPEFWVDQFGDFPDPFTIITKDNLDVELHDSDDTAIKTTASNHEAGAEPRYKAFRKEHRDWAKQYVENLEKGKKFQLTIWPEHCLIGTPGHCVQKDVLEALHYWERKEAKTVNYVLKGTNSFTEHYSAIKAEVEVAGAEDVTGVNHGFVNQLKRHDKVVICGQALSHCLNYTTRDLVDQWNDTPKERLIILDDATSPVAGFEEAAKTFLDDMKNAGLQILSSTDENTLIA